MSEPVGGDPEGVLRHRDPQKPFAPPSGESHLEAITAHVERHFGPVDEVFHEIVSDQVHLDVLIVGPSEARPFVTLVTSGMSELPMHVPDGDPSPRFAELVMSLVPAGELTQEGFADERVYWPLRHLKQLARMPHLLDTWLAAGQTVSTDPPGPVAAGVPFCAFAVLELLDEPARRLQVREDLQIAFLQVVALHEDELRQKLEQGAPYLEEHFDAEWLRVVFNDRPSAGPEGSEHYLRLFGRGRNLVITTGVLLFATAVVDAIACHFDGVRLPWGRLGLTMSLSWYLGEGQPWARWLSVALLFAGVAAGVWMLLDPGFPATWRRQALLASMFVWLVCAGLLLLPPSVRFYYRGRAAQRSDASAES
ncbi:MAG: suppressor of fused domain protein [Planctomycetes bacterium]|nr:suppressor of fused domain protein [Planctomycetota bacterium]